MPIVATAPKWKFTVQAVTTDNGNTVVAVLVAPGIPIAGLDPARARKIGRALIKAADSIDSGDEEFPALGGAILGP